MIRYVPGFCFIITILVFSLCPATAMAQETRFGFLGPDSPERNPAYYQEFTKLGVDFDRPHIGPFVWEYVEPDPGTYDWTVIDNWVGSSQENNVHILASIWPFANWDQQYWRDQADWEPSEGFEKELPVSRYKPHDTTAYKAWVTAMVERYDGDGVDDMPGLTLPVTHWEVLNEPETYDWDGLNFFKGGVADYLEVLRLTTSAIRDADPDAVVLHGGSTGISYE